MDGYGKIYVVATPIGNLEDITFRALKVLKEVDLIAAEDTRHTLQLLNYFEISKPLISYYKENENVKSESLIKKVKEGKNIAIVSDAGTPRYFRSRRSFNKRGYKRKYRSYTNPRSVCICKRTNCIRFRYYKIPIYRFFASKCKRKRRNLRGCKI